MSSHEVSYTMITAMCLVLLGFVLLEARPRCKPGSMSCRYHNGRSEIPETVRSSQSSTTVR